MSKVFFSPGKGFMLQGLHSIPVDAVEISAQAHAALLAGQAAGQRIVTGADGQPELRDPPPVLAAAWVPSLVQRHLDVGARRHGYDSMASAVSYASEPAVPRYQLEGQALRAWRSLVWHAAHAWLNDHPDTTQDALLAALPPAPEF